MQLVCQSVRPGNVLVTKQTIIPFSDIVMNQKYIAKLAQRLYSLKAHAVKQTGYSRMISLYNTGYSRMISLYNTGYSRINDFPVQYWI